MTQGGYSHDNYKKKKKKKLWQNYLKLLQLYDYSLVQNDKSWY